MRIGSLGLPELLIILLVVLLIFGPRRLPDMAKGLGQSVREFRKGVKDMKEDFESEAAGQETKGASASKQPAAEPAPAAASAPAAEPAAQAETAAPVQAEAAEGTSASTEPEKKEA